LKSIGAQAEETGKAALSSARFSLRGFVLALTNPRKLKRALLKQKARRTVPFGEIMLEFTV